MEMRKKAISMSLAFLIIFSGSGVFFDLPALVYADGESDVVSEEETRKDNQFIDDGEQEALIEPIEKEQDEVIDLDSEGTQTVPQDDDTQAESQIELSEETTENSDFIASGTCGRDGDSVTWTVKKEGEETVLTLSGQGEMETFFTTDYDESGNIIGWTCNSPYWQSYDITKAYVQGGIHKIGDGAFDNCSKLKSVTIENGVAEIGAAAFYGCNSLEEIIVPPSISTLNESIGDANYRFLYTGTIDDFLKIKNNKFIIGSLYTNYEKISEITLPHGTKTIPDNAFYGFKCLKKVNIPDGLDTVGEGAFYKCENLSDISIPDSVKEIGKKAFSNCSSLKEIKIPSNLTIIQSECFASCTQLSNIAISPSVKVVENGAFYMCPAIINFPNEITVNEGGLSGARVEYVRIAEGEKTIPDNAFNGIIYYVGSIVFKIELPDTIETIGNNAFRECTIGSIAGGSLGDFVLPKNLKTIENGAFYLRNTGYDRIIVPAGETYIGNEAFNSKIAVQLNCPPPDVLTTGLKECKTIYYPCSLWSDESRYKWAPNADWIPVHNNQTGNIIEQATCTKEGLQELVCKDCGTITNEVMPVKEHEYNSYFTVDSQSSCDKEGVESIHCSECNAIKEGSQRVIPKVSHKYGTWRTTKAATEIAFGQKARTCTACGHVEKATIAMLKPTLPAVTIKAPKAAKKAATVKWTRFSKAKQKKIGYFQIQYSTDKSFKKGVKTVTAKKTAASKKITKLTSKKVYYFRIRSYLKSGSKVHVSKWSTVKSVKAK